MHLWLQELGWKEPLSFLHLAVCRSSSQIYRLCHFIVLFLDCTRHWRNLCEVTAEANWNFLGLTLGSGQAQETTYFISFSCTINCRINALEDCRKLMSESFCLNIQTVWYFLSVSLLIEQMLPLQWLFRELTPEASNLVWEAKSTFIVWCSKLLLCFALIDLVNLLYYVMIHWLLS